MMHKLEDLLKMYHGTIPADIMALGQVLTEKIQELPVGRYVLEVESDEHVEIKMRIGSREMEIELLLTHDGSWVPIGGTPIIIGD